MNQTSSTESSASSNVAPDVVSRRAYELWENEGRPEGCDMRHWLQAEQELAQSSSKSGNNRGSSTPARNSDVTPLQGTRAAAAMNSGRDVKRSSSTSTAPFSGEKNGNGSGQQAQKRKASAAPAL